MSLPPRGLAAFASAWCAGGALLVCLSVAFVDRPVARLMHAELRHARIAASLAELPETIFLVPLLALAAGCACLLMGARPARVLRVGGVALASYAAAEAIKTALKFAFGRTWPETWVHDNPSFIRDGVYAFAPFHGGHAFDAFPSGHMTAASAVMTVAWLLVPRYAPLWALVVALSAAGLVALNFHFVGDVVAGFFLGTTVAVVVTRLAHARSAVEAAR